jgi:hypothetical protein
VDAIYWTGQRMSGSDNCFDVLGDFIMVGYVYEWLSNGVIQTAIVLVACSSSWRKTRTGELALHMHVRPFAALTMLAGLLYRQVRRPDLTFRFLAQCEMGLNSHWCWLAGGDQEAAGYASPPGKRTLACESIDLNNLDQWRNRRRSKRSMAKSTFSSKTMQTNSRRSFVTPNQKFRVSRRPTRSCAR